MPSRKADDHMLRYFYRTLEHEQRKLNDHIKWLEAWEKDINKPNLEEAKDQDSKTYFSFISKCLTLETRYASRMEKSVVRFMGIVEHLILKENIKDYKTREEKDSEGRTTYSSRI
jgi:hypothetical protein